MWILKGFFLLVAVVPKEPHPNELSLLRDNLKKSAASPEHDVAVGAVANAEIEARNGNGPKALEWLSTAGKWAFDKASAVGVGVAAGAIKSALGL